jgi:Sigma-70 region 2
VSTARLALGPKSRAPALRGRLMPDGSLVATTTLSMSRPSEAEPSAEAAQVVRLVRTTLAGDSTAFEALILRYETRVMSVAVRLLGTRDDARDAAQEAFLRAFKYLHTRPAEAGQRSRKTWHLRLKVNDVGSERNIRRRGPWRPTRSRARPRRVPRRS